MIVTGAQAGLKLLKAVVDTYHAAIVSISGFNGVMARAEGQRACSVWSRRRVRAGGRRSGRVQLCVGQQ
eukprot:9660697-Lingulodinium_polyedra.AAC.1